MKKRKEWKSRSIFAVVANEMTHTHTHALNERTITHRKRTTITGHKKKHVCSPLNVKNTQAERLCVLRWPLPIFKCVVVVVVVVVVIVVVKEKGKRMHNSLLYLRDIYLMKIFIYLKMIRLNKKYYHLN